MSSQILKKPSRNPKQKSVLPKKPEEESALLILLKKYSLHQYHKALADRGFDQNLKGLISLSENELNNLLDSIRFFPGHRSKFVGILALLRKHQIKEAPNKRSSSQRSSSKKPTSHPVPCRNQMSSSRPQLKKILSDCSDLDLNTRSGTDRSDMAIELEEAYKKIRELTIQLENRSPSPGKSCSFDPFEPLPSVSHEIRELGMSYDSSKMRSTLHYLDIEEICMCLSKYLRKMITGSIKSNGFPLSPGSSRSEITTFESVHEEIPLGIQEIFNKQFYDPFSKTGVVPDEDEIYNISKNIIIRSKMEKECSIICLIYIERLKNITGICPSERNWKRLLFFCLILSSKIWDDESYENQNFADVFSNITLRDINNMEVTFLNLIDFKVGINKSEYAKYYFILRTFADKNHRSFPLVPLDVDTVRKLQSAANNAESKLREIHEENLYKTL